MNPHRLGLAPVRAGSLAAAALTFLCCSLPSIAQTSAPRPIRSAGVEPRAARAFEKARGNPLELYAFLAGMPKGGDLHNHLTGAVYAESWIRAGAEDHLCVVLASLAFAKPDGMTTDDPPVPICPQGDVPAAQAYRDSGLYDSLIDSFSMRGFVPAPGVTGHDHFFATFAKFGGTDRRHTGEWLDEVATRAAAQNEQYLELMVTPNFDRTIALSKDAGWSDDLGALRDRLLATGLRDDVAVARAELDQAEKLRRNRERCGRAGESKACQVELRYLYQVLRGFPKEQVFAQTVLGFEVASADPRVIGINYVMPEDGAISMADYDLHMRMVGFLHGIYPKVHISLHAGELAPGLVPPDGLCCHIRLAVETAHAERIGHGVDIMYEDRPYELLKEMAGKHVMVEINLTSNAGILGVSGKDHPLPEYQQFGVPVALSTDDEGVNRSDMTHEYVRAAETYGLSYAELKRMARTSLEHSFLTGASLWREPDAFTRLAVACQADSPGADKPSRGCSSFLSKNEKAQQQWALERRFRHFESSF
jgi:adenosine deaminase